MGDDGSSALVLKVILGVLYMLRTDKVDIMVESIGDV